jgi:hypothetical protein
MDFINMKKQKWKNKMKIVAILYIVSTKNDYVAMNGCNL